MRPPGTIAITGAGGFFGWHLRARLRALDSEAEVRVIGRPELADRDLLCTALSGVDVVVHLAGANRGDDAEVHATNVMLAQRLVDALTAVGEAPYLVNANTIHAKADTSYGRSKREAGLLLSAWGRRAGSRVSDLRFPNLFGEGGRPDYNSAVATFCHDLATGRDSKVNPQGRTELLHVQDACALVLGAIREAADGTRRIEGRHLTIADVYSRLARLHAGYSGAVLPEVTDRLDLRLFNSLRTAMFPTRYPLPLESHRDWRGSFAELARGSGDTQASFAITAAGHTRGEHFHLDKVERFVVVAGTGRIKLRKLFSSEVHVFEVSGEVPVAVDMPTLYAHSLTNTGSSDLLTVIWANDHFDANNPDTYPERVESMPVGASA